MSACNCRDTINAQLVQHNTKIKPFFTLGDNRVSMPLGIATEQIETGRGKKRAMVVFATFCPFCGVNLEAPDGAE